MKSILILEVTPAARVISDDDFDYPEKYDNLDDHEYNDFDYLKNYVDFNDDENYI